MRKRRSRGDEASKQNTSIGLLPSMLIIIMAALLICVILAMALFSVVGSNIFAGIKANEMAPHARYLVNETRLLLLGYVSDDMFRASLRSGDTTIIVFDTNGKTIIYADPMQNNMDPSIGDLPITDTSIDYQLKNGTVLLCSGVFSNSDTSFAISMASKPPEKLDRFDDEGSSAAQKDNYIQYCNNHIDEAINSKDEMLVKYSHSIGVVVGLPVENIDGTLMGVLFLIKPVDEIRDASQSVILALTLSVIIVAIIMLAPTYAVTRWLTTPVKNMTVAALKLAEGDFGERVAVAGSYEIRELGASFNALADNLQENIGNLVVERNRLRAVLDGLGEGIIAVDIHGNVTHYNSASVKLLGGSETTPLESLAAYDYVINSVHGILSGVESNAAIFKSGERTVRVSSAAIHEKAGAVAGVVALLMDVTEAERLEQTRRDYVANVSHELRTPLASLRSLADMLNDGLVKNDNDRQRYYGYILKESMRLSTLINDLLELSRLQSGGVALVKRRVELYELIMDVVDRMADAAAEKGMNINVSLEEGVYYANSNNDRIEQVLISLVDNAVKHGTADCEIRIGVNRADNKWHIFVENNADVDKDSVAHLFERFYKADTAHTGDGTGLGLAIAEEVLRLLDERIYVDYSNGVIRFTFTVEADA